MDSAATENRRGTGTTKVASQFVGFELAGEKYAFRIEQIQEIVLPTRVVRIPDVPRYVDGVGNLRGTIIPIIDLRVLFGLETRSPDAETRTVVVNVGPRTMGCNVDAVSRVMHISADQIQPTPDTVVVAGRRFIEGFARVGADVFILLDVDRLLDPESLDEVHRVGLQSVADSKSLAGVI